MGPAIERVVLEVSPVMQCFKNKHVKVAQEENDMWLISRCCSKQYETSRGTLRKRIGSAGPPSRNAKTVTISQRDAKTSPPFSLSLLLVRLYTYLPPSLSQHTIHRKHLPPPIPPHLFLSPPPHLPQQPQAPPRSPVPLAQPSPSSQTS